MLLELLIDEIIEAFNVSDFPVLDAFHAFNPKNKPLKLEDHYGMDSARKIFTFYGQNKIDVYEGRRNEAPKIMSSEECFLDQAANYFKFISKKKEVEASHVAPKLVAAEKKLKVLEQKKKCRVRDLKAAKQLVLDLKKKSINPVSLNEAFKSSLEIFPDVAVVLNIIKICPSSGAVVERGFSLMNLIMNDLRSSMKVTTLDSLMRIHKS